MQQFNVTIETGTIEILLHFQNWCSKTDLLYFSNEL